MSHKKMNPEVKKVWINELRSGRYKQTDAVLRRGNAFCCLGVLCDLSKAAQWKPWINREFQYAGGTEVAPSCVEEWAGLNEDLQGDLAKMNDDGKTFAEIADWIERHL